MATGKWTQIATCMLIAILVSWTSTAPDAASGPGASTPAGGHEDPETGEKSNHLPIENYPTNDFILPVNREVKLSGTFGELRSNHFHSGIDIKSLNGSPGEPLYAAADGHVSRIKMQAFSYGKALYIDHPNGFTTVYAHLDAFNEELEAYVRKKQYQHQSFSVDLYPDPDAFQLKQGDLIGKLGNSGYSFGPHLHFEIRKTATQVPVNPMLFGLPVRDGVPPKIQQLVVYHLNDRNETIREKIHTVIRNQDGTYTLPRPLEEPAWRVAFGLKTYDQMDGTYNRNGVYALDLEVDGDHRYGFRMDEIPFHLTRYLNAHIDYRLKQKGKGYINRCYQLPGNQLGIYRAPAEKGIVPLYENKPQEVRIQVSDAEKNTSELVFQVQRRKDIPEAGEKTYHFTIPYDKPFRMEKNGMTMSFQQGTFYEDTYLACTFKPAGSQQPAGTYHVGSREIPVHKYFDLTIDGSRLDPKERDKVYIAYLDDRGRVSNYGGSWDGDLIRTRSRALGQFTLRTDTTPPNIRPASFSKNMRGWKSMSFIISDDLPTGGDAMDIRYSATIDGNWILMEYDGKNDRITHRFDGRFGPGEHLLRIRVSDDRGNSTVFEETFII